MNPAERQVIKLIVYSVDELTLVIMPNVIYKNYADPDEWSDQADELIELIAEKSQFEEILGPVNCEITPPQGYTVAYSYGCHAFYFAVAYHPYHEQMGIIVKFSAQALAYYLSTSGYTVYKYLRNLESLRYELRLSRIDFAADYIDENVNITQIYNDWNESKIAVTREYPNPKDSTTYYRKCPMKVTGFLTGNDITTIYFGSNKSKSKLCIYDKRLEQFQKTGPDIEQAKACDNWVQFEVVFMGKYAHQLTKIIQKLYTDEELAELIANVIYQKYRFMIVENGVTTGDTEYTVKLLDAIRNKRYELKAATNKNFDLARSILYLCGNSGLFATLFKVKMIWGDDGIQEIIRFLKWKFEDYQANHDVHLWIVQHRWDYRNTYPTIDDFIKENIMRVKE